MELSDTAAAILDAAQELAQTRGYNAFSYRDLAERVGIRTASIHYHFPTKGDLGRALVARYGAFVSGAAAEIERRGPDAPARLRGYAKLLEQVLAPPDAGGAASGRVCLGGMLASEYPTLPPEVQRAVRTFVDDNVRWLAGVLGEGRDAGTLTFAGAPEAAATALFSGLEGAMLVARATDDVGRYRSASGWLLTTLTPKA
jgi:TetR/AcrR family transcriptional repressor of nem operon